MPARHRGLRPSTSRRCSRCPTACARPRACSHAPAGCTRPGWCPRPATCSWPARTSAGTTPWTRCSGTTCCTAGVPVGAGGAHGQRADVVRDRAEGGRGRRADRGRGVGAVEPGRVAGRAAGRDAGRLPARRKANVYSPSRPRPGLRRAPGMGRGGPHRRRARRMDGVAKHRARGRRPQPVDPGRQRSPGPERVIAVGPPMETAGVDVWVREDPPGGGPVRGAGARAWRWWTRRSWRSSPVTCRSSRRPRRRGCATRADPAGRGGRRGRSGSRPVPAGGVADVVLRQALAGAPARNVPARGLPGVPLRRVSSRRAAAVVRLRHPGRAGAGPGLGRARSVTRASAQRRCHDPAGRRCRGPTVRRHDPGRMDDGRRRRAGPR